MTGEGRDEKGRFAPGNQFWLARTSHGADPEYKNPDDLWASCCEYFQWVSDNPLYEDKVFSYQGEITHEPVAKMQAMTISGLCLFLGIETTTWRRWRAERTDLCTVITRAEQIIYHQKFTGAAADLLNANIIARDLGLADKQDHSSTDGSMSPKQSLSRDELQAELERRGLPKVFD